MMNPTLNQSLNPLDVHVNPNSGGLPGGQQIQQVLDGLGAWALLAALGGLLVSVIVWSIGSNGGNYHAVSRGKTGVLVCGAAAMVAGGAAPIINFFANLGSQIR
ncbi:MAG: hypothetical protein JWR52_1163 [Marmoricola sp.]|nr:hypothetical protein [Marmoricola sp.]